MSVGDLIGRPDRWARLLGWALAFGLLCGVIGPFGSYPANMFTRLAYWIGLFVGGTLIGWPIIAGAATAGPARGFPLPFSVAVAVLAATVPIALLAAAGGHLFWPMRASGMRALEWYGQTLVIVVPAAAGALWLETRWHGRTSPMSAGSYEDRPAARALIPDHLLAHALCLQMEDHHVRVHGVGRSWLHLATLREAIDQIGPERGLQVHRSWWVARDAVCGWASDERTLRLRLVNGLDVPVARNRVAAVRAEGWLKEPEPAA